jgi:transposase
VRVVAEHYDVTPSYIYKALMRRRITGNSSPNPNRGHNPRKLSSDQELALAEHMRANPGITLARTQDWLEDEHQVSLSTGALWNAVRRLGLSFKKRH